MEEQDRTFRDLCDDSFDLIQRVSPEGRFLFVNQAWLDTLGYTREEVDRLALPDIIHPDDRARFDQTWRRLLAEKTTVRTAARLLAKTGLEVAAEGILNCRPAAGEVTAIHAVFRDLSRRRMAEEELDRLFSLSLDLLCVAGVDGFFRHINPAFVRVLGYSEEELLSRSFLEFVHPEDREGTLREVERLAQGLPVVDFQNRYRAQDGTYRWLAWRSAPWAERGLIYAVARDITEQRRTQELLVRQSEELARSNADLEQFAKVASHDLRTPLRHVANLATWIEEDMPTELPENVRSNLRRLRGMVRRMEKLTDGILSYARAGRDRGKICTVDTDSLLKELVHLLAPPEEFTVSWDPGMPVFETDESALEQVLRNLIDNAIKHHGRRDGRVTIAARELPDSFEFTVSDDGPGIPVHLRGEIFAMFRKGRSGDEAEGNGIGLALVQRIVEGYQRRVWVESTEGGGATLRFTWPRTIRFEEG